MSHSLPLITLLLLLATGAPPAESRIYLPLILWSAQPTVAPTTTNTPTPTATSIPSIPSTTPTSTPTPIPPPTGINVACSTTGPAQICAWVSNGAPSRSSTVTIYGRLLIGGAAQPGRTMTATWHYKTTTTTCTGTTSSAGIASCSRNIGQATLNYRVNVDIAIDGHQVTTWFIPQ